MSLKIYLDDCANSRDLIRVLRAAGHDVVIPADVGLTGARDPAHFAHAAAAGLVLLTKNPRDFAVLHQADSNHAGIVVVYQDNDPTRDMTPAEIARALANLVNAGGELRGTYNILNAWRY